MPQRTCMVTWPCTWSRNKINEIGELSFAFRAHLCAKKTPAEESVARAKRLSRNE